ncbi:MAG TPA: hypothetical protein VHV08_11115 [Pirellulales bacterium]|jgi:hypothetical protein|nr:hypothetical protein [Pirellulales bacterium]
MAGLLLPPLNLLGFAEPVVQAARSADGYFHQPLHIEEWIALVVLVTIAGGLVVGAIAIITEHYRHVQRDEMDATLKMEMLQRGMSADEIVTVLSAVSGAPDAVQMAQWSEQAADRRQARRMVHEAMRAAKREQHHA